MKYGSVCSGIEAATVAWRPLGWECGFMSEIDKFPRAVLSHHYPQTPMHGDFTTIKGNEYGAIDLLVGGTPCQSFSIAGLRGGLGDARGNLALAFLQLTDRARPRWLVWENVPGVLSSNGGRDFGSILGGMVELGYGFAYRVLDAQYFGVAQRRRRVFVVGSLGDWRRAAAVLFERESLRGDSAPRRETRERIAPTISSRPTGGGGLGPDFDLDGGLIPLGLGEDGQIARALNGCHTASGRFDASVDTYVAHALRGEGFDASEDGTGRGTPLVPVNYPEIPDSSVVAVSSKDHGADAEHDLSPTLRAGGHDGSHANAGVPPAIAFNITPSNSNKDYNARESQRAQAITSGGNQPSARGGDVVAYAIQERAVSENLESGPGGKGYAEHTAYTLEARNKVQAVATSAVRRLTPRECERLQGFPDDYTLIPYRGGVSADGPRYKALGNSMAVPVMRWIGERIQVVDDLTRQAAA